MGENRQFHWCWWKLVELLFNACAIGIQVLFERKTIKMATSQCHLVNVLKILSADTQVHRNRLKVWILKQQYDHKRKYVFKIINLCTSPERKMIVCDKHGWQRKCINDILATKRRLAQKFARRPTLNLLYVFIATIGKRKTK